MKKSSRKKKTPKRVLRLPDLDYAKGAVLNTLGSPESKRGYEFAIDDFVTWYCSEPRLAFSKIVVLRYRLELEIATAVPFAGVCVPAFCPAYTRPNASKTGRTLVCYVGSLPPANSYRQAAIPKWG